MSIHNFIATMPFTYHRSLNICHVLVIKFKPLCPRLDGNYASRGCPGLGTADGARLAALTDRHRVLQSNGMSWDSSWLSKAKRLHISSECDYGLFNEFSFAGLAPFCCLQREGLAQARPQEGNYTSPTPW